MAEDFYVFSILICFSADVVFGIQVNDPNDVSHHPALLPAVQSTCYTTRGLALINFIRQGWTLEESGTLVNNVFKGSFQTQFTKSVHVLDASESLKATFIIMSQHF